MTDIEPPTRQFAAEPDSLRENDSIYRIIIDTAIVGIWETDAQGVTVFTNPMLAVMLGAEDGGMIGRPYWDFVFEEDLPRAHQIFSELIQGKLNKFEFRFKRADNEPLWAELSVTPLTSSGKIIGAFAIVSDISERRQLADNLRVSYKDMKSILDNVPSMIGYWDKDQRNRFGNYAYRRWFGVDPDKLPGVHVREVIGEESYRLNLPYILKALGGEPQTFERAFPSPDGDGVRFSLINYVPDISRGEVQGFYVLVSDITPVKQAEDALKQSEELNRKIIQATPDCIKILNEEEQVEFFSASGLKLLKLESDAGVIGKRYSEFWRGSDKKECMAALSAARRGEIGRFTGFCPDAEGCPMWWDVIISPLEVSDKPRFLVISRDITKRIQDEEELREAKKAADAANSSKSEFLARMSHEIRTPMNAIMGMTELSLHLSSDPLQSDYLQTAIASSRTLLAIINDVLDYSKIEAQRLVLNIADFDFHEFIDSLHKTFSILASQKQLYLRNRLAPDLPRYLRGDVNRLRQVLTNLLGNAIKFTQTGGVTVDVSWGQGGFGAQVRLRFIVADTGPGIMPEKLESIFDPFTQDASNLAMAEGTGLGLAISKRLVEMMEGALSVESVVGKGSAFAFDVSLLPGDVSGIKRENIPLYVNMPQKLRVLVVDDNAINLKVARALLTRIGHESHAAQSGEEAIRALSAESFDVVLLDLEMPGMDGMETTRRIRAGEAGQQAKHVKVIAVTAHALSGYRERCLEAGMDGFIPKPMGLGELMGGLACALEDASGGREARPVPARLAGRKAAIKRLGGDAVLHAELCQMFASSIPDRIAKIKSATKCGDLGALREMAHAIKGTAATIGDLHCSEQARALEMALQSGEMIGVPVLAEHLVNALENTDFE
jgi:PAS domain S-box-containing protein